MAHTNDCPLVSIIIPTFNKADLAIETLKSVIAQSNTNWECIIVDDGSKIEEYNTILNFTKTDQRFTLHKRPSNTPKGANTCRNYGMLLSKGKYIQFFDSDDLMLEDCLKNRVRYLEKNNKDFVVFSMGILKGDSYVSDTENTIVNNWEEAIHAFVGPKRLPWNLQRTLYNTDVIKNKIAFNEDLKRFQDIEFNIRLLSLLRPSFKINVTIDCVYRKASENNPRSSEFFKDVFQSIPIFLNSIIEVLPNNILKDNKRNLQIWLYNVISLYTVNELKSNDFKPVISAARKYLNVRGKQILILNLLFFGKRDLNRVKGKTRFFNLLNTLYITKSA